MADTFAKGYALLVGVGADLPNTVDDAVGLANILQDPARCTYSPEQVHLLTGEQATRSAILAALDILRQSTDSQSTVLFYFSGHGYRVTSSIGESYYLMPHGYDLQRLFQTAVSGVELTERLRRLPARRLLVLLDCCHAGGVGESKAAGLDLAKSPLPPEAQQLLAEGSGRVLIASSQEQELSFGGRPYSAFTLALIEALSGVGVAKRDGYVRVADLALHAREVVPGRTGGRQHPILHFEEADNFPIAYYAGGETQPKGLPFAVEPQIEPQPGAWRGIDQRGQVVHGAQTNIVGDVHGPVLSGQFAGPVTVGGGDAVDMRGSPGAIHGASGSITQHFGNQINISGPVMLPSQGGEMLEMTPSPEASRLLRLIKTRLDLEELRTVCFDLGIQYDNLGGEGFASKARQLVLHLQQHEALDQLVDWLRQERPDIRL